MMYRLVLEKSATVKGASTSRHISRVTPDRVWISDGNNLILASTGNYKQEVYSPVFTLRDIGSIAGIHTVNCKSELIYIDKKHNINKLDSKNKVKTTLIKYNEGLWLPKCIYSSPATGDLLVGMSTSHISRVVRYNSEGKMMKTIQYVKGIQQNPYRTPLYITENRIGDTIVSDLDRGVVVIDRGDKYRFSYKGPPSGSGLEPRGICTDALSNILVCDKKTGSVQIIDCDGNFLSQVQIEEDGISRPCGLSYDNDKNLLLVGSWDDGRVNLYRVEDSVSLTEFEVPTEDPPQHMEPDLDIQREYLLKHMKTGVTTVRHARGIVVGCAGAGKTTLLYSLMGKSLDEIKKVESTRGLQVYEHIFTVKEESFIAAENLRQKPLIRVPKSLLTKKNEKSENADQQLKDDTEYLTKVEEKDGISEEITEAMDEEDIFSLPFVSDGKPNEERPLATSDDTVTKTLSLEVIKTILDAQENEISVSMIDFAGQFEYYACHQIYMRSTAFYILVIDMSKSFEEIVIDEEEDQKGSVFSTWKYKDNIEFWLNSIKSFGSPKAPVFIVATHTEGQTEDDIDEYFACLWRALPEVERTWFSKHSEENEFAFELINIDEGERTQKLQSLKNSFVDVVSNKLDTKIPVPSSWALLEHLLRDSGKPIMSYEEIQEMNRKVPEQYRLESEKEIPKLLTFFHDHGIILYFDGEATRNYVILDLQWFSDAFSRLVADKKHINRVCRRQHIKEWELFNQTGELNSTLAEALWKDVNADVPDAQSFNVYKNVLMSYMERLQMLVSIGDTGKAQSWYVPCMNKKKFTHDIISRNLACSSILCFRFTSFAMFVFYRLIAYCLSSLNWKVVPDKNHRCLFQTAAVFEFKNHTVLLGICDKDIQLQVVVNSLDIITEVSCEVGYIIHNALEELTTTFQNTNLSFQRGYKCQKIFCDENDASFIPREEIYQLKGETTQCSCCPITETHIINVHETRRFWDQENKDKDKEAKQPSLESQKAFEKELQQGSCKIRQFRIMVVGHYGVGKTTLTYGLIGKDKKGIERTDGIDLFRARCRIESSKKDTKEWCLVQGDFCSPAALAAAPNVLPANKTQPRQSTEISDKTTEIKKRKTSLEDERQRQILNACQDSSSKTHETEFSLISNISKSVNNSDKTSRQYENKDEDISQRAKPDHSFKGRKERNTFLKDFYQKTQEAWTAELEVRMKDIFIDLWDFGGQNVFYTTHQSFLTSRCIYLLVINCAMDLNAPLQDRALYPTQQSEPKVEDFIDFWLSTITNYAKSKESGFPRIVLIGTHVDELGENASKRVTEVCSQIQKRYQELYSKEQLVIEKDLFFNAQDTDKEKYALLREFIIQQAKCQPHWEESFPKSWLHLLDFIVTKREERIEILTLRELKEFNQKSIVPLTDSSLENMLQRQHEIGDIIFFNTYTLKDIIILDPSFLIKALKSLISTRGHMEKSGVNSDTWRNLSTTGVVLEDAIKDIWSTNPLLHKYTNKLLGIFQHMDILVKPKSYDDEKQGNDYQEKIFFIPCMIEESGSIERIDKFLESSEEFYESYNISINNGILVPPAIGYRLLSFCTSMWPVVEGRLFTACGFFRLDLHHILILRTFPSYIRVYIVHRRSKSSISAVLNSNVNRALISFLETCLLQFHGNFQIFNGCQEKHDNASSQKEEECKDNCPGIGSSSQKLVEDVELLRLSRYLNPNELGIIGTVLGILDKDVKKIEKQHPSVDDQRFYVLHEWRKRSQPTFSDVERVLVQFELDKHTLCKVYKTSYFDKKVTKDIPRDKILSVEELDQVAGYIGQEYFQLGLELGLTVSRIEQIIVEHRDIPKRIKSVLHEWRKTSELKPTVKVLGCALLHSGGDFHSFCQLFTSEQENDLWLPRYLFRK